jgi:pimeloyl-ACP methyl ester carboxylesterase
LASMIFAGISGAAVADASGLERFALFGMSQGASIAVRYAVKHPERVSCVVIFGGYMRGRLKRGDTDEEKFHGTGTFMIREGWGSPNPVYRNFFTSTFLPDAPQAVQESFDELQRICTDTETALRIWDMNNLIDTVEAAKQIEAPTLVLHIKGDRVVPVAEGRLTARLIPNASFIELPGNDHVAIEGQPSFDSFFDEARAFLAEYGDG